MSSQDCGYECKCSLISSDGKPNPYHLEDRSKYADPENGKYPIDTKAHVKAAWSYINMPRNAKKYSSSKLATIKSRIRAAAKKFGIKISEDNKSGLVSLYSSSKIHSVIDPPAATDTHFFTSGRVLSYFPEINKNGFTFFKEDVEPIADTLFGSTTDLQHVKFGSGVTDPLTKFKNTTCGAIIEVQPHDKGIDILCKIERSQVAAMGYTAEDFEPKNGIFSAYSQECEYNAVDSKFIVVDKNDHSKILKTYSLFEGLEKGFPFTPGSNRGPSYEDSDGKWHYTLDEENPVFMSVKPSSFSGVGQVMKPADGTALTYRLAAMIAAQNFPGMDEGDPGAPALMIGEPQDPWAKTLAPDGLTELSDFPPAGTDLNPWFAKDFIKHPDILHADVDNFMDEHFKEGDEPPLNDYPNTHYAAVWMEPDYENMKDGKPSTKTKRAFRIRDNKGNLHRGRLLAAYRALTGLRGCFSTLVQGIPMECRAFAMALVRRGLQNTKPIPIKEKSSHTMDFQALSGLSEAEAMAKIEAELKAQQKVISKAEYDEKVNGLQSEIASLKSKLEEATNEKTKLVASFEETTAKLKEFADEKLASSRLAELEKILPFEKTEKEAEAFVGYYKNLASMSDESFRIEKLTREIASRDKQMAVLSKSVSSAAGNTFPKTQPIPPFSGETPEGEKPRSYANLL